MNVLAVCAANQPVGPGLTMSLDTLRAGLFSSFHWVHGSVNLVSIRAVKDKSKDVLKMVV